MGLIDKTNKKSIKPDSILYQAYKMMGIPYLWEEIQQKEMIAQDLHK